MAHPYDIHVGTKIRRLRKARDMSQQALAEKLGVRFQQVQKYETGANRISASKLIIAAQVFETDLNYFAEGLDDAPSSDKRLARVLSRKAKLSRALYDIKMSVDDVLATEGEGNV